MVVEVNNMNLLNSFNDFYDNLSSNGLFFFWIIVFLFVFLIFLIGVFKVDVLCLFGRPTKWNVKRVSFLK